MREPERAAFEEFARARLPQLLRFGLALTGDRHRAADLVQEALVRTGTHWSHLRNQSDPEGYVRQAMVRTNVSWWRKRRRENLTAAVPDGSYDAPLDDPMWELLKALPARQRAVLVLRYYEGLSEAEIAQVLGCSTGTVKSQASRALDKLRAAYEGQRELL